MINHNQKKILTGLLYIFLVLLIIFIATSYKPKSSDQIISNKPDDKRACIQVITAAKDPKTGTCQDFPTPCDVPDSWQKVSSCVN